MPKLTRAAVFNLQPKEKDYTVGDSLSPLRVKVTAAGHKTYLVSKRLHGRVRHFRIGDAKLITIDQARAEAKRIAAEVELGNDPLKEKQAHRQASEKTFATVAADYLQQYKTCDHTTKAIASEQHGVAKAVAALGALPASQINADAARRLLDSLKTPAEQRRAWGVAKRVMDLAVRNGLTETNILSALPAPKAPASRSYYPSLPELVAIWRACETTEGIGADIIRFLIAMPLRANAAATLTWGEVGEDCRELALAAGPGRKFREGKRIPLPGLATEILLARRPNDPSPGALVFGSWHAKTKTYGVFSGWSKTVDRLRTRSGVSDWTPHDFRRSMVSLVAEHHPHVSESALDRLLTHAASSTNTGVKAVYQRAVGYTGMREAADAWDALLREALSSQPADA